MNLAINIPLVDALLDMPSYVKFMKELVTKNGISSLRLLKSLIIIVQYYQVI